MLLKEPRKKPHAGRVWFTVDVSFVKRCTFEVMAANEGHAILIVDDTCKYIGAKIMPQLPPNNVTWCFGDVEKEIGDVQKVTDI